MASTIDGRCLECLSCVINLGVKFIGTESEKRKSVRIRGGQSQNGQGQRVQIGFNGFGYN